jgi:hypothetical protein
LTARMSARLSFISRQPTHWRCGIFFTFCMSRPPLWRFQRLGLFCAAHGANELKSFLPATGASVKTLLAPQVCERKRVRAAGCKLKLKNVPMHIFEDHSSSR